MYLPSAQSVLTAGLALTGTLTKRASPPPPGRSRHTTNPPPAKEVSSGSIMDYAVEKCLDSDGNQRCTKPFLVSKSTCYDIEWSTDGALSHTTLEVRDSGSHEIVYYRDTNGQWTPDKGEVSLCSGYSPVEGKMGLMREYSLCTLTLSRRCGRRVMILLSTRLPLASKRWLLGYK